MFQIKNFIMRHTPFYVFFCSILIFSSCVKNPNSLSVINSESFNERQINLHFQPEPDLIEDSLADNDPSTWSSKQQLVLNELDELIAMAELVRKSESDSIWVEFSGKWNKFNTDHFGNVSTPFSPHYLSSDSNEIFPEAIRKWTELNIELVKFSGEVRFGDALEKIVYSKENVFFPEKLLKSVIYTHVFDKVYINVIGSSSVDYQHTTGGNVRIIQETNYPKDNEMILKTECSDVRYMDIFIRIPSWAINPTVSQGNIKYVARPGEYCQISKKWKTGVEIKVVLKN